MERFSKLIRQRLQVGANQDESHPDPNLLAAFADRALAKAERIHVLEHLAGCADCRDIVSLAASDLEASGAITQVPASSGWLRGSVLRWGALAASVAVVTVAVTLPRLSRHPSLVSTQSAQTDSKGNAPEARLDEATDKLAASASPSSSGARETDSAAKQPKRAEFSTRMNAGRVAKPSRSSKAAEGYSPLPMSQAAVPASPPLLAKSVDADQAELKKEQGNQMQVAASNEVVSLANAAPAELESAPGKAKDAQLKTQDAQAGLARSGTQTLAGQTRMADASSTKNDELWTRGKLVPRWTLSSDGTLQRSFDAGKTWATIPFAGRAVFRALAAVGTDIWVGGSGGSLYRSTDAGEHWLKVTPAVGEKVLTADIIGVEFTDSNHGKLTTADEQIWLTADAGQTWQTN